MITNLIDPIVCQLACTLHFKFYAVDKSSTDLISIDHPTKGVQIIHLLDMNTVKEFDLAPFINLVGAATITRNEGLKIFKNQLSLSF